MTPTATSVTQTPTIPYEYLESAQLGDKYLSDSGLTIAWVLRTLWENVPHFPSIVGEHKIRNITSRDVSEGKGYLSVVYKCVVEFVDEKRTPFHFIMKVPCLTHMNAVVLDDNKEVCACSKRKAGCLSTSAYLNFAL
jgi:hypothetical protein